jgi:hypothetical protein
VAGGFWVGVFLVCGRFGFWLSVGNALMCGCLRIHFGFGSGLLAGFLRGWGVLGGGLSGLVESGSDSEEEMRRPEWPCGGVVM